MFMLLLNCRPISKLDFREPQKIIFQAMNG
jgi:hypothetical protein